MTRKMRSRFSRYNASPDCAGAGNRRRQLLDDSGRLQAYGAAATSLAFVFYRNVAGEMNKFQNVATQAQEIWAAALARAI
jgi:hypothetical protein